MIAEEKSILKRYIIGGIIGFIPDLFFSWIIGKMLIVSMWYVWIGVQIVKFCLWIIRGAIGYLLFHFLWKKKIIDSIYSSLVKHQYPDPQKYFAGSASEYFSDVMLDDEIEMNIRLDAAQTYGTTTTLGSTHGLFEAIRMEKVILRAIDKYHTLNFSGRDYQ